MRLTFLGTGTSFGVPALGCSCRTCTSSDARDRRSRHGALVELAGGNLLVDTPPELRLQLLDAGVSQVDAVWYTHLHADHVHGIDDLRIFTAQSRSTLPAYVPREYAESLRTRFDYIFDPSTWVAPGTSIPDLALHEIEGSDPLEILGEEVTPLPVPHGRLEVYGFRVGRLGYITDAKSLPLDVVDALKGVDVLVLNALWWGDPHATHLNIEEAIETSRAVAPGRTYLTHLTHRVLHAELAEALPEGIFPAYDGLVVEVATS